MGYLPIFLALALFLLLWGIVVGTFISSEKKKILSLSTELGIEPLLAIVDGEAGKNGKKELKSLKVKMLSYNKLISRYPYKIVAGFARAEKF